MQKSDVPGIMEIEKVSFGRHHWSAESFEHEIQNDIGHYFSVIDLDKNKVVGYGGFWLILDEAHITTIAVCEEYRKNKIGEAILQAMVEKGYQKEVKWFTLEVRVSNIAAQKLYEKYGFQSLGVRKNYYQDNSEDAIIMWTENIWHEKFKTEYNRLKTEFNNKKNFMVIES